MSAITPGPWRIEAQRMTPDGMREARRCNPWAGQRHVVGHGGEIVATVHDGPPGDAALLVAAPELAAALGRLVVDVETIVANHAVHPQGAALDALAMGPDSPLRAARLALAKVGGAPADTPDPVAILRRVLRWYGETTDGEMPPELHDDVCRAVGEEVGE